MRNIIVASTLLFVIIFYGCNNFSSKKKEIKVTKSEIEPEKDTIIKKNIDIDDFRLVYRHVYLHDKDEYGVDWSESVDFEMTIVYQSEFDRLIFYNGKIIHNKYENVTANVIQVKPEEFSNRWLSQVYFKTNNDKIVFIIDENSGTTVALYYPFDSDKHYRAVALIGGKSGIGKEYFD